MILRLNDTGLVVGDLQRRLYGIGFTKLEQNNVYDAATRAAVATLQRRHGLVSDGKYGPKTEAVLLGRESGRLLKQSDLVSAAKALDVPLAAVMAVNEAESQGMGFLPDGRPKILFERHQFYKRLVERKIDVRLWVSKYPGVVNAKRGGYAGGASEYMRLSVAATICRDAAYESCSWGLFQIMGFHWERLGFGSVVDYVAAMQINEGNHLDAFVKFIMTEPPLHKALKAGKWAEFARLYNGPAYEENLYDIKLARAFSRYDKELKEAA